MKKAANLFLVGLLILLPALTYAALVRDPTQPPGVPSMRESIITGQPLDLTAIFVYPDTRIAIINGQAVKTGDNLGGYHIISIQPDKVELSGPQEKQEILHLIAPVKEGLITKGQ